MKPLIGISGNTGTNIFGSAITSVPQAYSQAIQKAGGIPIIFPFTCDKKTICDMVSKVNGVLFPGGIDVDPHFYGENPAPEVVNTEKDLDEFHMDIFHSACDLKHPILAICRGTQLVNVALGGSLCQDIPTAFEESKLRHMQEKIHFGTDHKVKFEKGSRLCKIFGSEISINSRHHQCIKKPGEGLMITAAAPDGVVEAAEHKELPIDLVQWHPELMLQKNDDMLPLFKHFVGNCFNK